MSPPSPRTIMPGDVLNQRPAGTSGSVASQSAGRVNSVAGTWRCDPFQQMAIQRPGQVGAANQGHALVAVEAGLQPLFQLVRLTGTGRVGQWFGQQAKFAAGQLAGRLKLTS